MKWMSRYSEDKKILFRMIALYTLLATTIVILLTGFMYIRFSIELREQIQSKQQADIKAMANTVSFRAEYVNYLMTEARQDRTLYDLFYHGGGNEVEALRHLDELRMRNDLLQSVYVCNEDKDTVYCSSETNSSKVSNWNSFEDQGFVEILKNIEEYPKGTPILRQILFESPNGEVYQTYVYTYLMYDVYNESTIRHIVAFNFHMNWISEALDYINQGKNPEENIWIIDDNDVIVYAQDEEKIGTRCQDQQLLTEIRGEEAGSYIQGNGKNSQMVVYSTPQQRGYKTWTFISQNSWADMMEPVRRLQIFSCIVAIAFLLVSGGTIVLLSNRIFVPIRNTFDKVKKLEEDRKKNHKIERGLFLRRFFRGDLPDDLDAIEEKFSNYHIQYNTRGDLRAILFSIDYASSFRRKFQDNLEAVEQRIENILESVLENFFHEILLAGMQGHMWLAVIPENEYSEEKIRQLFNIINEKTENTVSFSLAVSDTGHSVRDIPYLYSEVMNLQSYLYLLGRNRILTGGDVELQNQRQFEYPHELEKKFLGYLFSGKQENAQEIYREFVSRISGFSIEDIKQSFVILAYSVKRASYNTTVETVSVMIEFEQFYKKLQTLETMEEVNQMFMHLIEEIAGKSRNSSKERHEELIQKVKNYVAQNYSQITLSINVISDHVDMSSAYLGRLFKQVTGISFVEYLTGYRLQIACDLLLHSEMTVNEISDAVGFTNSSYFYIIFKKNFQCTPGQYRKEKRGDEV